MLENGSHSGALPFNQFVRQYCSAYKNDYAGFEHDARPLCLIQVGKRYDACKIIEALQAN